MTKRQKNKTGQKKGAIMTTLLRTYQLKYD
jgi:hypothetical protein